MSSQTEGRSLWGRPLMFIVAAGMLLRIGAIAVAVYMGHSPVRGDAITYDSLARSLASGKGYVHEGRTDNVRPPAYPFALSLVYRLSGPRPIAGAVAQAFFDSGTIVVLAATTLWLTASVASALVAAGLFALWPGAIFMNVVLYTEPFYTLLLLLALTALMRMETTPRPFWIVATGLAFGLLGLTRQTTLYFMPLYVVAAPFLYRSRDVRRILARVGALVLCVAVLAPWTIRDKVLNGEVRWIQDYSGLNLWLGNHLPYQGRAIDRAALDRIVGGMGNRATDSREVNRELTRVAIRSMREHPGATAWLWVQKAYRYLFVDMRPGHVWIRIALSLALLVLYLAAIVGARSLPAQSSMAIAVVATVFGYFLLLHVVTYSQMRFAEPVRPIVLALAGHGLIGLWRQHRPA